MKKKKKKKMDFPLLLAIQTTPTLGALLKIPNGKIGRRKPHRKLEVFADALHLQDVEPQQDHFDAHAAQLLKPAIGDHAPDLRLVAEHVGVVQCEAA